MPLDYLWKPQVLADEKELSAFKAELPISEIFLSLLLQRGISNRSEAEAFFNPNLQKLHNPFLMKDMDKAVYRINQAIKSKEKIMVYGDYDVDGTTAVALFSGFLEKHYPEVSTYIPDRYKEGYGVSQAGIDFAAAQNISLIIALDCGIKAIDKVDYALARGIDFIICDHHTPGDILPKAAAVLDPKRSDCVYPYKGLSGCGVGFKLVQALCEDWDLSDEHWRPYLDLLAVSIGADIVPMSGENRILTYYGLQQINSEPSPGLESLIKIAKPTGGKLDISDVVFMLAPRINAAGRLAHGKKAVELLRGQDLSIIDAIAQNINKNNTERKSLDQSITEEALRQIQRQEEEHRKSSVVYEASWHKGVIGIVASRLIENYYRPTIVFTKSGDKLAGSARTVAGFDVYQALLKCDHILEQFGGHPAAAGMTLKEERYEEFKTHFEKVVSESILPEQLLPNISYDLQIKLEDLSQNFYNTIQRFAPFGPDNLSPIFRSDGLINQGSRAVGEGQKHLKLGILDPDTGIVMDGIGFGMAHYLQKLQSGKEVSILYHLEQNVFRNKVSLQLRLLDLKLSEELS
ncbi:MAG: single-stranded-DNA-specific exonuclease RecJ [Bacteroidetes bacterium]|nr:MAG: single-stranded-DNA-specific exonuclease RecJ [Bacteroidota bacterium]